MKLHLSSIMTWVYSPLSLRPFFHNTPTHLTEYPSFSPTLHLALLSLILFFESCHVCTVLIRSSIPKKCALNAGDHMLTHIPCAYSQVHAVMSRIVLYPTFLIMAKARTGISVHKLSTDRHRSIWSEVVVFFTLFRSLHCCVRVPVCVRVCVNWTSKVVLAVHYTAMLFMWPTSTLLLSRCDH